MKFRYLATSAAHKLRLFEFNYLQTGGFAAHKLRVIRLVRLVVVPIDQALYADAALTALQPTH
jgi:hypothetical protein